MNRLSPQSKEVARRVIIPVIAVTLMGLGRRPLDHPVTQQSPPVRGTVVQAFIDRVNAYVSLRKKMESGLTPLQSTTDTMKTEDRQHALAARVREARGSARAGDVFGDAGPLIRDVIGRDQATRSAGERRATQQEVPKAKPPAVNAEYPERAALATVPPLLLKQLPRLPDDVEYRFMDRDLILRDMRANLIVDVLADVLPLRGR